MSPAEQAVRGPEGVLAAARSLAEEVLFPAALATDRSARVPASHLDLLAAGGFYGLAAPPEAGGAGVSYPVLCQVAEILTAGCLSTAFVWIQHQGVVRRVLAAPAPLRQRQLGPLCRGERRGGVALGGSLPGPPRLRAHPVPGGWRLDGESPWVTGWGMIDTLAVAARDHEDTLIWGLIDAAAGPALSVQPLEMVAAAASGTVTAHFDGLFLPEAQVLHRQEFAGFRAQDPAGLRMNGSLPLGVIARCLTLLGPGPLDEQGAACRTALDAAGPDELPAARAAAAELALRAAAMLVASVGSRAILLGQHPQRLAREAMFTCVFGTRPAIRAAVLDRLAARG